MVSDMRHTKWATRQDRWLLFFLLIGGVLIFTNLGNRYLWQDESETALLARSVLIHGYPRAFDGTNIISQELGRDYNAQYVWTWTPWLQLYLTVDSFFLFGESVFAARLPFAIIALVTIILLYRLALFVTRNRSIARWSTFYLITSIPFLLHVRQCRYYSLLALGAVWLVLSYLRLIKEQKGSSYHLLLSATVLFHTHFMVALSILAALVCDALLWRFRRIKIKSIIPLGLIFLALNLPWAVYFQLGSRGDYLGNEALRNIYIYLAMVNRHIFPFVLLIIPLFFLFRRKKLFVFDKEVNENIRTLITVSLLAIILLGFGPWVIFRYLVWFIPFACIFLALLTQTIVQRKKCAGWALAAVLVSSNILHIMPVMIWRSLGFSSTPVRSFRSSSPMANYIYEITHNYDGPNEALIAFFQENGSKDETVVATYGDLPLKFYTNLKVRGGLVGENLAGVETADWIVIRRNIICDKDAAVKTYLMGHANFNMYEPIVISAVDLPFGNRPEPKHHKFRTINNGSKLVIWRKIHK